MILITFLIMIILRKMKESEEAGKWILSNECQEAIEKRKEQRN